MLDQILNIIYNDRPTTLTEMIEQNERVWSEIVKTVDSKIESGELIILKR